MPWMTPQRLTPSTHSHWACVSVAIGPPPPTPALLHTTCTAPKRSTLLTASSSTDSAEDTSVGTVRVSTPEAATPSSASLRAPSSMSAMTTFIPSAAKRLDNPSPIPLSAPVPPPPLPHTSPPPPPPPLH